MMLREMGRTLNEFECLDKPSQCSNRFSEVPEASENIQGYAKVYKNAPKVMLLIIFAIFTITKCINLLFH